MKDRHEREIHYLRISVTDRCNLKCDYCMPEAEVALIPKNQLLSFEEITAIVRVAAVRGINKIRLTGGEPLVRRNLADLVAMLSAVKGIADLSMTTNGTLLSQHAVELKKAGLKRVNISLDSLDEARYRTITRGGEVSRVVEGIFAASKAGLSPIKINCVVREHSREEDAEKIRQFGQKHGFEVRYIRQMDIARGQFWQVEGASGGNCSLCNRLRLTSHGMLKPCLFSNIMFNVRELGIGKALEQAVACKPLAGNKTQNHSFYNIGG